MRQESSKMINALAKFCEIHAEDPNLFPPRRDNTKVYNNTAGAIISEHKECSSTELAMIHNHKLKQLIEGQEDNINA